MVDVPKIMRKQYLIKKGIQLRYTTLVLSLIAVVSIITGFTVFHTLFSLLGEKLASVYPQSRLIPIFKSANLVLFRNLILLIPVIVFATVLFSHRIAGPLYRIEKTLDEIGKGNFDVKIKLRRHDELHDIADKINTMTSNIRAIIQEDKKIAKDLLNEIGNLKSAIHAQPMQIDEVNAKIARLQDKAERLSKESGLVY